ncbi:hypothetical protein DPEC_G00147850 [Dallia pectoralis]|uniref:Uncharacterized protein n=1 Tax=Dallia pectoralis TaxID=75939 RepID=A0ACC2GID9_DALPE|nr:hypothetical protein DPEC_G00147850 [Dallia pectoralis]
MTDSIKANGYDLCLSIAGSLDIRQHRKGAPMRVPVARITLVFCTGTRLGAVPSIMVLNPRRRENLSNRTDSNSEETTASPATPGPTLLLPSTQRQDNSVMSVNIMTITRG